MYLSTKKLISRFKYVAKKKCSIFNMRALLSFTPMYIKQGAKDIYCIPYGNECYIFTLEQDKPLVFNIKPFKSGTLALKIGNVSDCFSFNLTSDIVRALKSFHRANYKLIQVQKNLLGL